MRSEKCLIIITLISVLVLTSCNLGGRDTPNDVDPYVGSDGLRMDFVEENPPNIVYYSGDSAEVNIMVELWNKGATDISMDYGDGMFGYVYLTGYDSSIISFSNNHMDGSNGRIMYIDDLDGKSDFNPEGGYDTINLHGTVTDFPEDVNEYQPNFVVSACYEYETRATPMVCVDPEPYDVINEKACDPNMAPDISGTQGAPVAVTSIKQINSREHIQFEIQLSNVGQGRIVASGALSQYCPTAFKPEHMNLLEYEVSLRGRWGDGECQPHYNDYDTYMSAWNTWNFGQYSSNGGIGSVAGIVFLPQGQGKLFCKFTNPANEATGAYKTPLVIKLRYGYTQSIEKEVTIKNIDT